MLIKFEEGIPIYMQIARKLKIEILSNRLKGGDKLPSVREIAETYKVNPNTVQRVFMELDKEKLTYSERGVGTFVTMDNKILENVKLQESNKIVGDFTNEMKGFGYSDKEILNIVIKNLGGDTDAGSK
ncbi:MAG: GntR family transcriptional regulator [Clostridiaceae bacterium]